MGIMLRSVLALALVAAASAGYAQLREFESSSCTGGWKSETYYVSSAAGKCHVVHNDNFGSIKASTSSVSVFANKDCSGNQLLHEQTKSHELRHRPSDGHEQCVIFGANTFRQSGQCAFDQWSGHV